MTEASGFQTWSQVEAGLTQATRKLRRRGDMVVVMAPNMTTMSIGLETKRRFRCTANGDSGLREVTPKDGRYHKGRLGVSYANYYQSDRLRASEAARWVTDLAQAWQVDVGSVSIGFNSTDKTSPLYGFG